MKRSWKNLINKTKVIMIAALIPTLCAACGNTEKAAISDTSDIAKEEKNEEKNQGDPNFITNTKLVCDIPGFEFRVYKRDLELTSGFNLTCANPEQRGDGYLLRAWNIRGEDFVYYLKESPYDSVVSDTKHYYFSTDEVMYYGASDIAIGKSLFYYENGSYPVEVEKEETTEKINLLHAPKVEEAGESEEIIAENENQLKNMCLWLSDGLYLQREITEVYKYTLTEENGVKRLVASVNVEYNGRSYLTLLVMLEDGTRQGVYMYGSVYGIPEEEQTLLAKNVNFNDKDTEILSNYEIKPIQIDSNERLVTFDCPQFCCLDFCLENPATVIYNKGDELYWGTNTVLNMVMSYQCINVPEDFPEERTNILIPYVSTYKDDSNEEGTYMSKKGEEWMTLYRSEWDRRRDFTGKILYALRKEDKMYIFMFYTSEKTDYNNRDITEDYVKKMVDSFVIEPGNSPSLPDYTAQVEIFYNEWKREKKKEEKKKEKKAVKTEKETTKNEKKDND